MKCFIKGAPRGRSLGIDDYGFVLVLVQFFGYESVVIVLNKEAVRYKLSSV